MTIFIRTFTKLQNLSLSKSYTYYKAIFKNSLGYIDENVLFIIYQIYFYKKVMSLQILETTVYYYSRKIRAYIYVE